MVVSGISVNPATALYNVLQRVTQSGKQSFDQGWSYALGAQVGTVEFIQRHSEVVGLAQMVTSHLMALPEDDSTRARYVKYLPAWYNVVVYRNGGWNASGHAPASAISDTVLDHLAGLGDRFDHRFGGEDYVLTDKAEHQLRATLDEWLQLLDEAQLPANIAREIRTKVDHILWLLDNVNLVGTQPVVERTRELAGTGFSIMAQRPSIARKVGSAMLGLVGFLGLVNETVDNVNGILAGTTEMIEHVHEIQDLLDGEAPKELPGPPGPHQLPTDVRASTGNGQEAIDAEFVEEE